MCSVSRLVCWLEVYSRKTSVEFHGWTISLIKQICSSLNMFISPTSLVALTLLVCRNCILMNTNGTTQQLYVLIRELQSFAFYGTPFHKRKGILLVSGNVTFWLLLCRSGPGYGPTYPYSSRHLLSNCT